METRGRNRGLVGPLILIGAGVLFLLGNLGLLEWSVWELFFRFWPVILIAFGLEVLIGRRSLIGSLIVVAITIGIIGAILVFAPLRTSVAVESQPVSRSLDGATRADVSINFGAGDVRIGALADSANLIEGTVAVEPGRALAESFGVTNGTATYRLGSRNDSQGPPIPWGRTLTSGELAWDLRLSSSIPIRLDVDGGVGQAVMDLSKLNISNLQADLGVGRTSITLPASGQVEASIKAGVGEVEVVIPQGMAARIRADSGLGGVNVTGNYSKQGDTYTSPGFDAAQNRVDLRLNGGIGSVTVR